MVVKHPCCPNLGKEPPSVYERLKFCHDNSNVYK